MKILYMYVVLLLLASVQIVNAQDLIYVIKVQGTIKIAETGEPIKTNDKVSLNEKLKFESDGAKALVYSTQRGRMVLEKKKAVETGGSEILYYVKENLLPVKAVAATRSVSIFNNPQDIRTYFNSEYLLLDGAYFKVNENVFPLSDQRFFYIRYTYKGEKINKKLDYDGNKVIFDKKELLKVDENPISAEKATDFKLFYYNRDKEISAPLHKINFVFAPKQQLKAELSALQEVLEKTGKNRVDMKQEITDYIVSTYGKFCKKCLYNDLDI